MSKYNGEVFIKIGDVDYTLVYDWAALADIQDKHGVESLLNLANASVLVIADILLAGLKRKHPAVTKEFLLDNAPPILIALKAIDKGVSYAFYGADTPEASEGEKK